MQLPEDVLREQAHSDDLRTVPFETLASLASSSRLRSSADCSLCNAQSGAILDQGDLLGGKTLTVLETANDQGIELRQYTSTDHDEDMDTVPPMDAITVMERISKVEQYLLEEASDHYPPTADGLRGWVTIRKHKRVGRHGFQQVRLQSSEPPWLERERHWRQHNGGSRPARLEVAATAETTVGEFRGGVTALLDPSSPRALEVVLFFRPSCSGWLHQVPGDQRWGMAQAIREVTGALRLELSLRGYPEAYTWVLHAGQNEELFVRLFVSHRVSREGGHESWVRALKDHLGLS